MASREDFVRAWACMDDDTGAEILRQLDALSPVFADRVTEAAWGGMDAKGRWKRDWRDPMARGIAVVAIHAAYNSLPSEYQGETHYRVAGYTMGFFRTLCSRTGRDRDGREVRLAPSRAAFGHVSRKRNSHADARGWMGELVRFGLLDAQQFDASKVDPSLRTKPRKDEHGNVCQWAFNQWFWKVRPWRDGHYGPTPLRARQNRKKLSGALSPSLMERMAARRQRKLDAATRQTAPKPEPSRDVPRSDATGHGGWADFCEANPSNPFVANWLRSQGPPPTKH